MTHTPPSEAAASSPSPYLDPDFLRSAANPDWGSSEPVRVLSAEVLRLRAQCPPTEEVEKLRAELDKLRWAKDDVARLRAEKCSEVAVAIEHLRRAGIIVGSPTAGPTPGVAIGEPMTLASTIGMLCDERARILAGLGREAKALLEASFMLRCAEGGRPLPAPRVEETFGIFEALRKVIADRDAAKGEEFRGPNGRLFRLSSAEWESGNAGGMPSMVGIYGSGDMGRGEVAYYERSSKAFPRGPGVKASDLLDFGPAEAQSAVAAIRDLGPELAKAGVPVGPRCSHAEAVAQLHGERDRWREKFEAADHRVAAAWVTSAADRLFEMGFSCAQGVRVALNKALNELTRLRKESKRDQVAKQQAIIDEIARLFPGKGPLLERAKHAAKVVQENDTAERILGTLGIGQEECRRAVGQMVDDAAKKHAPPSWLEDMRKTQPKPDADRKPIEKIVEEAIRRVEQKREASGLSGPCTIDGKPHVLREAVGPATGQPRTEVPVDADGSGTVVELGEAFRRSVLLATPGKGLPLGSRDGCLLGESVDAAKFRHLHAAVSELAQVVERIARAQRGGK